MSRRKIDSLPEKQFVKIKKEIKKECPSIGLQLIKIANKHNVDFNDIIDLFLITFEDEQKTLLLFAEQERERFEKMSLSEGLQTAMQWIERRGDF